MSDTEDTNRRRLEVGHRPSVFWKSRNVDRSRQDAERRAFDGGTACRSPSTSRSRFVDLGAGTGAAARTILDHYSAAHAVLADFSPQMMGPGQS